ncbi:MAG: cytochrome c biogenesis protein CcsA [Planctomycetaceae bacterium]|nr:cytochrome c biogenesis protein CcsA [Planctomycetaceae bacterium]
MSTTAAPGEFRGTGKDILASSDALALRVIQALASLKLTCVLFLLAMVIVFVGSLAQSRRDVWQVMAEYFRCYIAWIDLQDLFPPSMFGNYGAEVAKAAGVLRYIPFPGGWTIGWLLLSNLIAAHALKFKVRATGMRLAAGLAFIVVGLLMMWLIVYTGNQQTGVEAANWLLDPTAIWYLMQSILGLAGISTIFAGCLNKKNGTTARAVIILVGTVLTGVFLYYVLGGEKTRLNLSSMRILWQLLKGTACSIVLLIGSNLLFEKRGGIALLHFGVAMLMISELQVGLVAKENMVMLTEGETTTFARDVRERELAILFRKESGEEDWVTISEKKLVDASKAAGPASDKAETSFAKPGGEVTPGQIISLADLQSLQLPFDLAVRSFVRNSTLRGKQPGEEAELAKGLSSFATVDEVPPVNGMDSQQDESSVFVDVIERASGKILASLLVSQNVSEMQAPGLAEKVSVADKDYYFYLRFQRNYKPYEVKLIDVSRKNYVGTATPRDYRSEIEITEDGSTEKFTLWMNNPLRYKGETFYQSGYTPLENGKEATTLSVVRNSGWMLPYIACMIVSVGMFAQFGQTLLRFLDRSDRRVPKAATGDSDEDSATPAATFRPGFAPIAPKEIVESPEPKAGWMAAFGIPAMVTLIFVVYVVRGMAPPKPVENAMNLYRFAQLPIAWNGRAQPVDSLARTQLMLISSKSTFEAELEPWQLSDDKVREAIIKSVQDAWPQVNVEELKSLKGTYSEWIAKVIGLTEAEPEAVEARLRPLMVRKAPAVHWLLDVMTRPEVAARHRVLKIEDDKILSLLGLPKRGGLTYSIAEVRKNLDDLENIMRNALAKKNAKTEVLDVTEGRVLTLFDNLRRINQLADVFGVQETDNALDSAITSWRILRALGNEPAVMAVPTGYDEDEQRSWETYVAASAVSTMNEQMAAQEISNYEQFAEYLKNKRPLELVQRSVIGSYGILLSTAKETASEGSPGESVRKAAEDGLKRVDDIYLRNILTILAKADTKKTPEEIANEITLEQAQSVAAERISSDLFQVISLLMEESPNDKRLTQIRSRLQALGTEDSPALTAAMNEELGRLVWDDLQARVGQLMPGGKANASFTASAKSVTAILDAWKKADVGLFNESVTAYQTALKEKPLPHVDAKRVAVEAWFNYFEPFYKTEFIYLPILILTFVGWLLPLNGSLRKTSLFLLVFGLLLHTLALGLRMWISGRPPVTNLYSSAIFIGWAVVIMAMIVELILKNGIGNLVGAASGAGTLMIAHYLARDDGDTLGVMQAVLDTAFWLATHVVCITLGYAATFLAGFLGLGYLGLCVAEKFTGPLINKSTNTSMRVLTGRMVYGVLCFALFFSLVGTVLGGLWADDSWGRFWGWDPKENGAMLIVIWNAVILHARWDKMVADYGTAVLAMLGNIVTAWSWFGVNELGAGLHAYGFTEGRLYALFVFVVIQAWVVVGFTVFARSLAKPVNASAAG